MNRVTFFSLFLSFAFLLGCAQSKKTDYVVTIKTNYGDMVAILYDETPKHKENFIKLAKEKYFDSLLFHRVIPNFMIQGGDPNSKKANAGQPIGTGSPGYTLPAEFVPSLFHEKGSLSAARQEDKQNPKRASNGSQFYIVHGQVWKESDLLIDQEKLGMGIRQLISKPENKPLYDSLVQLYQTDQNAYQACINALAPRIEKETGLKLNKPMASERLKAYTTTGGSPHLDDEYTVFGKVIKGLEVIDKIAALERNRANRPKEDVRMFVTVEELSKKKITKLYGYEYPKEEKKK
ncbi:peptidylprolyl isomerase [Chryseotalea sanaruensis]|uniref:Peptidyl-prolyl cis-trans isomerase n=1 Tax=Chryseotalea sanaruensis TaxID=2482724 RepID=A0A401UD86_9BACT|nr:peptidylprolyl isomerase [Chryseotalea sanaruensis]GCC52830.1 peptidylprolyl isomerase [Chryseotalea sanaruensis]